MLTLFLRSKISFSKKNIFVSSHIFLSDVISLPIFFIFRCLFPLFRGLFRVYFFLSVVLYFLLYFAPPFVLFLCLIHRLLSSTFCCHSHLFLALSVTSMFRPHFSLSFLINLLSSISSFLSSSHSFVLSVLFHFVMSFLFSSGIPSLMSSFIASLSLSSRLCFIVSFVI